MVKITGCMSCQEARNWDPPTGLPAVLIGIRDPGSIHPPYRGQWVDVLRLNFWDVEMTGANYKSVLWTPTGSVDQDLAPATKEQIKAIWDFIKKYSDHHIFAHCEAGISRSGAVRQYLNDHGWVVQKKLQNRQIHPNTHVMNWLRYFDREGKDYEWPTLAQATVVGNS